MWFLPAIRGPVTRGTTFIILSSYGGRQRDTDKDGENIAALWCYAAFLTALFFATFADFAFAAAR